MNLTTENQWPNDLMRRRSAARFLQRMIEAKVRSPSLSSALCVAIDGGWGTGKTFFIEQWAQELKSENRCVVLFDAWKNDLSDDPLLSFISEITSSLKPWIEKIPTEKNLKENATNRAKELIQNAAKAIGPLATATAKHVAAKIISNEAVEIAKEIAGTSNDESNKDEYSKYKIPEKELEKYFEAALSSHKKQQSAIESLIRSLENLASEFTKIGADAPIYIFIDELDRCRPTYAIRLLEGMKHILNAKGICFVVSTNLPQLSHSIKSVYGVDFDGRGYLKRFIDYEYKLPPPNYYSYCKHEFSTSSIATDKRLYTGLTDRIDIIDNSPSAILAHVAITFDIDLRSIKQVMGHIEAAVASIPEGHSVHCFYIFSLAAIAHKSPEIIDKLCSAKYSAIPNLTEIATSRPIEYCERPNYDSREPKNHSLLSIINHYQAAARHKPSEFPNKLENKNSLFFADINTEISRHMLDENRLSINLYPHYIRMAGAIAVN